MEILYTASLAILISISTATHGDGIHSMKCSVTDTMPACKPILTDCPSPACQWAGITNLQQGCCKLICLCGTHGSKCAATDPVCDDCPDDCERFGEASWDGVRKCCSQSCYCGQ